MFIKSKFGVEEPSGDERNFVEKKEIDLVIVPGLCFDKEGNRYITEGNKFFHQFLLESFSTI